MSRVGEEIGWGKVVADELGEWPHSETGKPVSCRFVQLEPERLKKADPKNAGQRSRKDRSYER